jgi:hypothetical protein
LLDVQEQGAARGGDHRAEHRPTPRRAAGATWERADLSRGVIRLELTKSGRRRKVPLNDDSDRALVRL